MDLNERWHQLGFGMAAIQELLRGVVDYAGLFPPAALPMDEVVDNYANYLRSAEISMRGRIIFRADRLDEFEEVSNAGMDRNSELGILRVSALVPAIEPSQTTAFDSAIESIQNFNDRQQFAIVDAIEIKTATAELVGVTAERIARQFISSNQLSTFAEVNWDQDPEPLIREIAKHKSNQSVFAKIRTGGVTPDLIPSPVDIARFIVACVKHDVGFKATAGLHHPIRSKQKLTYEDDAPIASMHGFLNVFIASVFAFEKQLPQSELVEILSNENPTRFVFSDDSVAWGPHAVSTKQIINARETGIVSFGSCSFTEPTSELLDISDLSHQSIFSR